MKTILQTLFFFLFVSQTVFAQWVSVGLEEKQIKDIAVYGTTVFMVTSDSGSLLSSWDEGINWVTIIPDSVKDIALHVFSPPPIQRSMLCLIMEGDYYWNWQDSIWEGPMVLRSTDWGNSWVNLDIMEILPRDPPFPTKIMNIVIDPIGDIYFGIKNSFIGYSTTFAMSGDYGLTWTHPGWEDTLGVGRGGVLFDFQGQSAITYGESQGHGAAGNAIHWSSDSGQSWLKSGHAPDWGSTTLNLCLNGNIFLGGLFSGLFISTDMCSSWTKVSFLLPECGITLPAGGILVGTNGLGVFLFSDNGDSLGSFNEGLSNLNVYTLAMDNNGYLYAGTDNGVWRRALSEIVPVELTSFTATVKSKEVTLNWTTATELNNHGFEVQRKFSSNDFVTIGSVKGHGTTTSPNNYSYIDKLTDAGKYFYRLKQIDFGGKYKYAQTVEVNWSPFTTYKLEQNYPNPFNPTTTIGFGLLEKGNVRLSLLNILGEEIKILLNEEKEAGYHSFDFDASYLPSGVYFYQLRAGRFVQTKQMLLLK